MRRQLVILSLATTVLVVISFLLPLGALVRRQAADTAKVNAEQDAQTVASVVALAVAVDDDTDAVRDAVGELPEGTIVVLSANDVLGSSLPGQGSLVLQAVDTSSTVASHVFGGWEIALPVVGVSGVVVVDSFVTDELLSDGVITAWLLLGLLGLVLIGAAVWVADRMGRGLTAPVEDLAASAHQLAEGELDVRVDPSGPTELHEMGHAFNYLADRLGKLLEEERENVADLSHRLRTPLTSLRLQAETLEDPEERAAMMTQVDRLEHTMTEVIEMARSQRARGPSTCDLNYVVRSRADFWRLLADEQQRHLSVTLSDGVAAVPLGGDVVAVVVDTLVDNVFGHTPKGTPFAIQTTSEAEVPVLEVGDEGPGFGDRAQMGRGVSGRGSTGLGLDIVRKTVLAVGGDVTVNDRPGGGAVVRVRFGPNSV